MPPLQKNAWGTRRWPQNDVETRVVEVNVLWRFCSTIVFNLYLAYNTSTVYSFALVPWYSAVAHDRVNTTVMFTRWSTLHSTVTCNQYHTSSPISHLCAHVGHRSRVDSCRCAHSSLVSCQMSVRCQCRVTVHTTLLASVRARTTHDHTPQLIHGSQAPN